MEMITENTVEENNEVDYEKGLQEWFTANKDNFKDDFLKGKEEMLDLYYGISKEVTEYFFKKYIKEFKFDISETPWDNFSDSYPIRIEDLLL